MAKSCGDLYFQHQVYAPDIYRFISINRISIDYPGTRDGSSKKDKFAIVKKKQHAQRRKNIEYIPGRRF